MKAMFCDFDGTITNYYLFSKVNILFTGAAKKTVNYTIIMAL